MEASDPIAVGRYRTIAELGRGGMGRVLLGSGPDGRLVALKLVHAQLGMDEGFRARFRREVDASRRVSGAYTAAVIDADPQAVTPWLASVFVPGPSLYEAVEDAGALPVEAALRLTAGLAAALLEIHRAGLVHRDLKPSNVLLTDDGPRVIDFGIARAADSQGADQLTHANALVGSPGFMSPEQAQGLPVSPASDLFSLGAVLVMACTGMGPFAGTSTPQTLYNIVHTHPDLTMVPDRIRWIIEGCLAKDPAARPSPAQLLDSIGAIAPSPQPWPPAVHQLIARQHAEVAQFLAASQQDATLVEPVAPTIVQPLTQPGPLTEPARPPAPVRARRLRRSAIAAGITTVGIVGIAGAVAAAVLAPGHDNGTETASAPDASASQSPTSDATAPTPQSPAPSSTIGIDPGSWYQITNANSGQCVDATNAGTSDGTPVQQWTCGSDQANQGWKFIPTSDGYYEVVNRNVPALALDIIGGPSATANGAQTQLWTFAGGTNQQWKPVPLAAGKYAFVVKHSGLCLDVTNLSTSNGTQLQQWPCTSNDAAQTFTLSRQP
ncbi:RICIN domain-containing protein [Streptomyces sp. NPDC002589]|uniref:serine/threonine protein kinase n=1 Tax=Streptomyces sp. NPDC002589 TaxID=3154420 RepID=UPI003321EBD7